MGNLWGKGRVQVDDGDSYPPRDLLEDNSVGCMTTLKDVSRMKNICPKGRGGLYYRRWGDLPEHVVAIILSFTTPKDIAKLACVNRNFRDLSITDSVWQEMLPRCCADILAHAPEGAPTSTSSKKQVFEYLANGVLLENGTQDFWLDRDTGGVCRSLGVRGLASVRGWKWNNQLERPQNQIWGTRNGSRFAQTATCNYGGRLEIQGNLKCFFPRGNYILSWRLCFLKERATGCSLPATFSFKASDNEQVSVKLAFCGSRSDAPINPFNLVSSGLRSGMSPIWTDPRYLSPKTWEEKEKRDKIELANDNNWMEVAVGEFIVRRDDLPVEINFSMIQLFGKEMYVDSVIIRPTTVLARYHPMQGSVWIWYECTVVNGRTIRLRNDDLHF